MNPKKRTTAELESLIPDEAVRKAFMERDDIILLSVEEQEQRWQAHLIKVHSFWQALSEMDTYVIGEGE